MNTATALLKSQLEAYCASRMPLARGLSVSGLQRIFGGASRETWRFVLHADVPHGGDAGSDSSDDEGSADEGREQTLRHLILRRDPGASLIDTERRVEFAAYAAFADSPVPVPRGLWLEEDSGPLGHPFFIMEEITGCEAGPLKLMGEPYRQHHTALARQKWTILGHLSAHDPAALSAVLPHVRPEDCWRRELDHWQAIIERDSLEPQPILAACLRWLRRHPPAPPERVMAVHGDFRTGNLLVDPQGVIRAVLDWEMLHLGDPLEDLAWGMNRAWCFQNNDLVGGLAKREDAIAWWEAASGFKANREALHWWDVFNCVKAQAIWLSAARAFESGDNRDMMMLIAAWNLINSEDRAMLDLMGKLR